MAEKIWTPLELVKTTEEFFREKGVPSPRLDAEVLLAHVLDVKRMDLYTQFERPLQADEVDDYRSLVRRRARREPVSHILGYKEFMGLKLKVTPVVLTPRPETEILVEEAVRILEPERHSRRRTNAVATGNGPAAEPVEEAGADHSASDYSQRLLDRLERMEPAIADATVRRVLDLGTGSGCIAVAIAAMCRHIKVVAGDISSEALIVARHNAVQTETWEKIDLREGDLYNVCWDEERFDIIISNPPYLRKDDPEIWPEVRDYEPAVALYAEDEGFGFFVRIVSEAEYWLLPGGSLLMEVGAGQAGPVTAMMQQHTEMTEIRALTDHQGIERVIYARKPDA